MTSKPHSVFSRSRFADSDSWSKELYYGGAVPGHDFDLGRVTGYYGKKLQDMYGDEPDPLSSRDHEDLEQARRPGSFVRKFRFRRRSERLPESGTFTLPPTSTYVTPALFAEHYAAAAFAFRFRLNCETAVTIWWGALGAPAAVDAQALFSKFLKDLNDWLFQRDLPTAYFFSHENSERIGLHTHLAVYLCLGRHPHVLRDAFRVWAMRWPQRNKLGARPRAIRVTGPATETPWLHWHRFHYQVKGYDPRAVVRHAYNSSSGTDLMLSDLIACRWQDPGIVAMSPRVGHAVNLGPAQRLTGIPYGCDELRSDARRGPRAPRPFSFGDPLTRFVPPAPPRSPYVSPYEEGARDVRALYPREFNTRVTKLSYAPEPVQPPPAPVFNLEMKLI